MVRGRKPTPTPLRIVRGNPGRRPLPQNEPTPEAVLPTPPAHLNRAAKREWRRVGKLLEGLGLVTEIDRAALAAYCQAWGRWVEAEEVLAKYGPVTTSKKGALMQSPYLMIANHALEQMMRIGIEFGMTPSSRSRVKAAAQADTENPLDKYTRRA